MLLQVITNEVAKEQYVVYQCGCFNKTRSFPASLVPPAPSGYKPTKVFEGPLQSISADDTSVGEFMVRRGMSWLDVSHHGRTAPKETVAVYKQDEA
jgi:hypothetical protein